jgi:hypothetical protein
MYCNAYAIHIHRWNIELRFFVVLAQAVHQVVCGRDTLRQGILGKHGTWIAEQLGTGVGEIGEGLHEGTLRFVNLVKHHGETLKNVAVQYNSNSLWALKLQRMSSRITAFLVVIH